TVTLHIRETPRPKQPVIQQDGRAATESPQKPSLGLALQDIPPEFQAMFGIDAPEGALVVGVTPGGAAFDAGLSPGDVILRANQKKISSAKDFIDFSKRLNSQDLAVLYVQRGPENRIFVPLKLVG